MSETFANETTNVCFTPTVKKRLIPCDVYIKKLHSLLRFVDIKDILSWNTETDLFDGSMQEIGIKWAKEDLSPFRKSSPSK